MLKAILLIADGMADRPIKKLNWKTPLEVAHKPFLNEISKTGISGILDPISPGIPPGSDTSTLALLGYDARKVYSGRGALEALGSGIRVLPGDVAFRCNLATADEKLVVLDRRAGRIANEDAGKLAESLHKVDLGKGMTAKFLFKNTIQHRAVLLIRGSKLSAALSDSDPKKVGENVLEIRPLDDSVGAQRTANIANQLLRLFRGVLKKHPVNKERVKYGLPPATIVLCRGAGSIPKIKPLSQLYGIKSSCVGVTPLIRGVCRVAGMNLVNVKGATGTLQTDFIAKAKATVQASKKNDFVLLHVKAPDVASHDRNVKQKIEAIENIDRMVGFVLKNVDLRSTYLTITTDHTTSSITGNHEGDPVPIAITGPYIRCDEVEEFNERACAKGGLNRIKGMDLMPTLMNLLGKTRQFGS